MDAGRYCFDGFVLDPINRLLTRDSVTVDLNARYLDALALLVREAGQLVTKDRFLDDVWRGVPVTDEALTQCIKTLRRALGDSAANPRLIETVPKHGYRFIAPVETGQVEDGPEEAREVPAAPAYDARKALLIAAAGTIGGGIAGLLLGLFYGFAGASQPGVGAVSVLLVFVSLAIIAALIGAVGISLGIAAAGFAPDGRWPWSVVGGAIGGLVVGAFAKLLGVDAFNLMLGRSPGDITGAAEGALFGAAIGLGAWLGQRGVSPQSRTRGIAAASLAGAVAGTIVPLAGGRMFGGSLDLLARSFPESRLRLDEMGGLFGETGFGPISQMVSGGLEGLVFAGCIIAAITIARRQLSDQA
jgi:DNA-binding winged helix-turn-helix (wHTH) protein